MTQFQHKHFPWQIPRDSCLLISRKEQQQEGGIERDISSHRFTGKGKVYMVLTFWAHICQAMGHVSGMDTEKEAGAWMRWKVRIWWKRSSKCALNDLKWQVTHREPCTDKLSYNTAAHLSYKSKTYCKWWKYKKSLKHAGIWKNFKPYQLQERIMDLQTIAWITSLFQF